MPCHHPALHWGDTGHAASVRWGIKQLHTLLFSQTQDLNQNSRVDELNRLSIQTYIISSYNIHERFIYCTAEYAKIKETLTAS